MSFSREAQKSNMHCWKYNEFVLINKVSYLYHKTVNDKIWPNSDCGCSNMILLNRGHLMYQLWSCEHASRISERLDEVRQDHMGNFVQ